jgi:hypothetical protein
MKDEKAESAAELRREHLLETIRDVGDYMTSAGLTDADVLDTLKGEVMHLLDHLEAAETMPTKQPPTGVWQVELANGVVHNFVADRANSGNGVYEIFTTTGGGPGMTTFMRDYPKRDVAVLAVRSEKVVAYRRLADWDGEVDGYSSARWATASPTSEQSVAPKTTPGMYGPFATS